MISPEDMVSSEDEPLSSDSAAYAEALGAALDALQDALQWQLTDARWAAVEQILDAMQAALESHDLEALVAATTDLELAGPLRLLKIGTKEPPVQPQPRTRDRLNQMVDSIGGAKPTGRSRPSKA
jgi:hypothetical protein